MGSEIKIPPCAETASYACLRCAGRHGKMAAVWHMQAVVSAFRLGRLHESTRVWCHPPWVNLYMRQRGPRPMSHSGIVRPVPSLQYMYRCQRIFREKQRAAEAHSLNCFSLKYRGQHPVIRPSPNLATGLHCFCAVVTCLLPKHPSNILDAPTMCAMTYVCYDLCV